MGGAEISNGGWSAYELGRRKDARAVGRHDFYPGRSAVGAQDVIDSVYRVRVTGGEGPRGGPAARPPDALHRAAMDLAASMGGDELVLWCGGWEGGYACVPRVCSEDVRRAAGEADPVELWRVAKEVARMASLPPPPPPPDFPLLPTGTARVGGAASDPVGNIEALESRVAPYAEVLEQYRGVVARIFESARQRLQ